MEELIVNICDGCGKETDAIHAPARVVYVDCIKPVCKECFYVLAQPEARKELWEIFAEKWPNWCESKETRDLNYKRKLYEQEF